MSFLFHFPHRRAPSCLVHGGVVFAEALLRSDGSWVPRLAKCDRVFFSGFPLVSGDEWRGYKS